jgi:hypothetical protein
MKALRERRYSRGEGSALHSGLFLPPGKTPYPLNGRLGGPQDGSGQVWKSLPPPGFDPSNVQPVTSDLFNLKSKAIPLQALTGPEGSRRLRLTDLKTIDT